MFISGTLGHPSDMTPDKDLSVTMLRGLLRWGQEGIKEGARVIYRGGLSLWGMGLDHH